MGWGRTRKMLTLSKHPQPSELRWLPQCPCSAPVLMLLTTYLASAKCQALCQNVYIHHFIFTSDHAVFHRMTREKSISGTTLARLPGIQSVPGGKCPKLMLFCDSLLSIFNPATPFPSYLYLKALRLKKKIKGQLSIALIFSLLCSFRQIGVFCHYRARKTGQRWSKLGLITNQIPERGQSSLACRKQSLVPFLLLLRLVRTNDTECIKLLPIYSFFLWKVWSEAHGKWLQNLVECSEDTTLSNSQRGKDGKEKRMRRGWSIASSEK